jgi:hypothetical protein
VKGSLEYSQRKMARSGGVGAGGSDESMGPHKVCLEPAMPQTLRSVEDWPDMANLLFYLLKDQIRPVGGQTRGGR